MHFNIQFHQPNQVILQDYRKTFHLYQKRNLDLHFTFTCLLPAIQSKWSMVFTLVPLYGKREIDKKKYNFTHIHVILLYTARLVVPLVVISIFL